MVTKVYIIAELGNTHDGSLGLAKKMIESAAKSGANAVKIQTHIFKAESLPNAPNPPYFTDETRQQYFDRTSFTLEQYLMLKSFSENECGVEFLSSPFSSEAVIFLEKIGIERYKIPSGEVTNIPMLREVARTQKPVILSSGMSPWEDIDLAVNTLKSNGCEDLSILQCASRYPCPPSQVGLNVIRELKDRYQVPVGFSDHTLGYAAPFAAVSMGATIIEKHFTLSTQMYGSDAKHSMEPDEFRVMVDGIHEVESMLASPVNKDSAVTDLNEMKRVFEKSVISKCSIKKGAIIQEKMLTVKKPGTGISARLFDSVIGCTLLHDIEPDQQLLPEFLQGFSE